MLENYQATKKDFEAVEEGIKTVWRSELDFVFRKKAYIKNVAPVSFDSKFLYVWSPFKISRLKSTPCCFDNYQVYKFPHKLKITDYDHMGWCANAYKWESFLPKSFAQNKKAIYISGGFLGPFTEIHQNYRDQKYLDIYNTPESYLATLVHEFAHIYYNSCSLSVLNQKTNLEYLKTAINLFDGKKIKKSPVIKLYRSFAFEAWTELFAFCAEYTAASLFWPRYKKDLDNYWGASLAKFIQTPSLLSSREPHSLATAIGKILISQYPKTWPQKILQF